MATIQGIYIALFGRPADPAGLEFFNDATNDGADLTAIGDLAATDEYQDRFTGMSNEEIVQSIYQSLFERDGEAEGVEFFVNGLEDGTFTINDIAIRILDGAQGTDLDTVNAKIAAADLFTASLDLDEEINAYDGNDAADIGRQFIDGVDTGNPADQADVDAAIDALLALEGQAPGGGGGGGVITPPVDPVEVFLAEWNNLNDQYYAEMPLGQQAEVNNGFLELANDYVDYLNAGNAAILDVVHFIDGSRAQSFHDNVLANINGNVLASPSRPKDASLVHDAADAFADRPVADGYTANGADELKAAAWDFVNGIERSDYDFSYKVLVASNTGSSGVPFGDVDLVGVYDSIASALAAADTGDHVLVGAGHAWNEDVVLSENVTLQSIASYIGLGAGAVIDGKVTIGAAGGTVEGFVFDAAFHGVSHNEGPVIEVNATGGTGYVIGNRFNGIEGDVPTEIGVVGGSAVITGNVIYRDGGYDNPNSGHVGIRFDTGAGQTVTITGNDLLNAGIGGYDASGTIFNITGNTIAESAYMYESVWFVGSSATIFDWDVTIGNNTSSLGVKIIGDDADDILFSYDTVHGDRLEGRDGEDSLYGGQGYDLLIGGEGDDLINVSGAGSARIVFEHSANANDVDTIEGFSTGPGGDVLDFSDFSYMTEVNIAPPSSVELNDREVLVVDFGGTVANSDFGGDEFGDLFGPLGSARINQGTDEEARAVVVVQGTDETHIYMVDADRTGNDSIITEGDVQLVGVMDINNGSVFTADNFTHGMVA
ncbi:DUF4214 domain-containing protein [Mesorhizobium sp. CAU 1741]|uniref:DUF4214 domain-containing protein n=1 Tax=Mesorhizobium sp. CAU 1741 TaxID=3140366 RepID=UPI00325AA9CC